MRALAGPVTLNNIEEKRRRARESIPYEDIIAALRAPEHFTLGPQRLLLGLPRTGTSWLFWNFFQQAGTARTHFKEVNFLNFVGDDGQYRFSDPAQVLDWAVARDRLAEQYQQWIDDEFIGVTMAEIAFVLGDRNWDWYRLVCGGYGPEALGVDLTPNNFLMTSAAAEHAARLNARPFAILRDPIERAISLRRHENRGRSDPFTVSVERLEGLRFGARLRRLLDKFGDARIYNYADLHADPETFLTRLLRDLQIERTRQDSVASRVNETAPNLEVQFSTGALDALEADILHLDGLVPRAWLDQWRRSIDRADRRWLSRRRVRSALRDLQPRLTMLAPQAIGIGIGAG